jgi:hypothetical protein
MRKRIKKILHPLYDKPLFDHLRAWLGFRSPFFLRPLRTAETISDLFPWRVDDTWETRYDLMNIPSLVFPENKLVDLITIVFFDFKGRQISRKQIELEPFESKKILIRDFLGEGRGQGTFSCFHSSEVQEKLQGTQCYFNDRQYVSYSWKEDVFWNYTHGNIYCLSKLPKGFNVRSVVPKQSKEITYRPQLRMDDCDKFELFYVNPLKKPMKILVQGFDEKWKESTRRECVIPSRGLQIFDFNNQSRSIVFVENRSRASLLRPTIFKYYDSFFDVLHG